jgi:hypothetical protein
MVAVDRAETTSAAAAPVHRPAMAPCRAREPAGIEASARRAAARAAATGAYSASSAPAPIAASYRCAGHTPAKRSGNPSGPIRYTRTPRRAPAPVPMPTAAGAAGGRRAVQARITAVYPAITARKAISPVQARATWRLLGGASATRSTAALTKIRTSTIT